MKLLKRFGANLFVSLVVTALSAQAWADVASSTSDPDTNAQSIVGQIAGLNTFQVGITCPDVSTTARCAVAVVASQESKDAFRTLFPKGLMVSDLTIYPITLAEWLLDAAISIGN